MTDSFTQSSRYPVALGNFFGFSTVSRGEWGCFFDGLLTGLTGVRWLTFSRFLRMKESLEMRCLPKCVDVNGFSQLLVIWLVMDPESTKAGGRLGSMTWLEGSIFGGKILHLAKQRQLDGSHFFDIRLCFSRIPGIPTLKEIPRSPPQAFVARAPCKEASAILPIGPLHSRSSILSWSSEHSPDDHVHFFGFTLVQFCLFWEGVSLCSSSWACIQIFLCPSS